MGFCTSPCSFFQKGYTPLEIGRPLQTSRRHTHTSRSRSSPDLKGNTRHCMLFLNAEILWLKMERKAQDTWGVGGVIVDLREAVDVFPFVAHY